jgi:hypothetical protein
MTACPKCGYVRKPSDTAPGWQCPSCGIAYAKFQAAHSGAIELEPLAPAHVIESKEGLGWYALGALAWTGAVVGCVAVLAAMYRQKPLWAMALFGVLFWIAWIVARRGLSRLGAYMRFGTVKLALARAPVVGGELRGFVAFEPGVAPPAKLEARLACVMSVKATDKRDLPPPQAIFSEKAELAAQPEPGGRRAHFAFAIPDDAKPSGEEDDPSDEERMLSYQWTLRVNGPDAGGNLERSFAVEVLSAGAAAHARASLQPTSGSAAALVAANLLALGLVLAGLASVAGLVILYWAENVVIGVYTALRMLAAGRDSLPEKIAKTAFFSVHYGMFCLVHGIFVTALFLPREQLKALHAGPQWSGPLVVFQELWIGVSAAGLFSPRALLLPLIALVVSHGVSYYQNYLRSGRYLNAGAQDSFWRPYPRMVLLHVCIIGGGFLIVNHGSSVPVLAALVIGKTLIDLGLHQRSNRAG